MLTLSLLRHGKSAWDNPKLDDHERPLTRRGKSASEAIGAHIATHGSRPDLVLCSTAVRTRQTLDHLLRQLGSPAPGVSIEPSLYLAPATLLLERIRHMDSNVRSLLLIGHNPGLHTLALELTGSGLRRDITTMAVKFPSCGLAVLTFDSADWAGVRPAAGRLVLFLTPNGLG